MPHFSTCCLGIRMPVFRSIHADLARPAETAASLYLEEYLAYDGPRSASTVPASLNALLTHSSQGLDGDAPSGPLHLRNQQDHARMVCSALSRRSVSPPSPSHISAIPTDLMLYRLNPGADF